MINPYQAVLDHKGCPTCNYGESWSVEGPDGILESVSHDLREEAVEEAEKMNRIYRLGYTAGLKTNWDLETGEQEKTYSALALLNALKIADVHIGWDDVSLENIHRIIRDAIAKAEEVQP